MNTIPYNEIPNTSRADVGKTCLMALGCSPLAVEDTICECIASAAECGVQVDISDIDDHTDPAYLCDGDLVAVIVGDVAD